MTTTLHDQLVAYKIVQLKYDKHKKEISASQNNILYEELI